MLLISPKAVYIPTCHYLLTYIPLVFLQTICLYLTTTRLSIHVQRFEKFVEKLPESLKVTHANIIDHQSIA